MKKNNNKNKSLVTALTCAFALVAYLIADTVIAEEVPSFAQKHLSNQDNVVNLE